MDLRSVYHKPLPLITHKYMESAVLPGAEKWKKRGKSGCFLKIK
jgi:hypothetical protein